MLCVLQCSCLSRTLKFVEVTCFWPPLCLKISCWIFSGLTTVSYNLHVFICQAAYPSVFSRLGGSADSPSSLHDPKVPGTTLVSQPPAPLQPPQHQQQSAGPVNVVITASDTLPTSAPANQPTLSVTIPPRHRLGTPLVTQPTASHPNLQSTTSAFTSTTVSIAWCFIWCIKCHIVTFCAVKLAVYIGSSSRPHIWLLFIEVLLNQLTNPSTTKMKFQNSCLMSPAILEDSCWDEMVLKWRVWCQFDYG